jgi:serine phosphatase RsbU (regulator of sigma subunit)
VTTTEPTSEQIRTEVLARAATALAESSDVTDVAQALIGVLCPLFADVCEVALRGQDGAVWRVASGPGEMSSRVRAPVPDLPGHPIRRAVNGEFLVIEADDDPQEHLFGPADQPNTARALGLRSAVIAPLASGATNVGALAVAMKSSGRRFTAEDHELVRVIARLTGRTVDNLVTADLQRRVTARLRTANAIAVGFADEQDADRIAEILLRRTGGELDARSGLVYLLDDSPAGGGPPTLRLAAFFGHPAERIERWRTVSLDARTPVVDVVAGDAGSIWLESLDAVLARYPALGEVDDAAERSLAAVRLSHGANAVGAAFWTFDADRRFNDADRGFVELVAEQAAASIGRARATADAARSLERLVESERRQRSIARTLQASLLPRDLPSIDGFDIHVEYWPATSDMDVGGDFYDVFPIEAGRWGMVLGDVCGKGAAAAAVTGTARHSLRAAATHIRDEARVIGWVHDAIAAQPDAPYCTMAYAVLDASRADLRVVLAGHDQGIHIDRSGAVSHLGRYGTLLGIVSPVVEVDARSLEPGDLVVFHTDGVTDAPRGEAMERAELIELLSAVRDRPLAEIGATLRAALDRRRPSGDRDDTALLLLRRG